ncbi:alpha/beta fold hydrolase [Pseudonocardiaceae bacterium YIM PH 21723]|nr:alpha/beta fold hydrolase [Pseudonocardiaceae bacterium YIM PH 21723]
MPARIESFRNDGLTFPVRDTGPLDGEVIVLLHGWPQTSSSWSAVAALLNEQGYRTIAPDQRGFTPTALPRGRFNYRMDRLVGDVAELIGTIGAGQVHLVGHDWGAVVAWATAIRSPELLRTLTAVSVGHSGAFMRALLSSKQALQSWYMFAFQAPWGAELVARYRPQFFFGTLASTGMTKAQRDNVRTEILDRGVLTGGLNWYRAMPLMAPKYLRGKVSVPTTFVWSDGDTAVGPKSADLTAEYVIGDYRFEALRGVSHWIPEEKPAELTELITQRVLTNPR